MTERATHIDYDAIYAEFARTPYGERLGNSVRWEKYNTSNLSDKAWVDLLGDDANNLYHMRVTYEIAKQFIEYQNASDNEPIDQVSGSLILLAAIVHDQGEAIVGDISYGDKSQQHEHDEISAFEGHFAAMNPGMDTITRALAKSAIRSVIFDSSTPEGAAFNAIERVGYFTTALSVADKRDQIEDPEVARGIDWLIADVLLHQIASLIECAKTYSLPYELLKANAGMIHQLFTTTRTDVFDNYKEEAPKKQERFVKAQQLWTDFCRTNGL
jgi:hypothetical protein